MAKALLLTPSIPCEDATAAVGWLCDVLGFHPAHVFRGAEGSVLFAELHFGRSAVFVAAPPPEDNPWARLGPASIALAVDSAADVDELHQKALAVDAEIIRGPFQSQTPLFPDGSYQFDVRDPQGNLWTVGTYRPAPECSEQA